MVKCVFLSDHSVFAVQNTRMYIPQITRSTCTDHYAGFQTTMLRMNLMTIRTTFLKIPRLVISNIADKDEVRHLICKPFLWYWKMSICYGTVYNEVIFMANYQTWMFCITFVTDCTCFISLWNQFSSTKSLICGVIRTVHIF